MAKSDKWPYPKARIQYESGASFEGWIIGAAYPSSGKSAASWFLRPAGNEAVGVFNAVPSKGQSDLWRAAAGGIATLLESLPEKAAVLVRCPNERAMLTLEALASDPSDGPLIRTNGRSIAGLEIWKRVAEAIRDKRLRVRVERPSPGDRAAAKIFEELRRRAGIAHKASL
jgi:hypothetical protein